jgi:DNA-binding GntR family transcriptional regulator
MTRRNDPASAKSRAYENLRYRIITQDLPPGELLKDKELMAHYRIGRTPLREILIELQRQGLIRRVPRSGTWVAPLDLDFVQQIAEVRVPLERLVGELAARRISEKEVKLLERILEKAESDQAMLDVDLQRLMEYESRFHHLIYSAARNRKLEELLLEFQSISARLWHNLFFTREQLKKMFDDQREILSALKRHDSEECGERLVRHTQAYFGRINGIKPI